MAHGDTADSGRRRVTFEVHCSPGSAVFLAGTFNDWQPAKTPMRDASGDGRYTVVCALEPGTYEYKFVINGEWCADAAGTDFVVNSFGTLNSVITVV